MLQISSAKFFQEDQLHITKRTIVLYSNLKIHSVIETRVGRLEPVFNDNEEFETYLFIYENKMPKGGVLIAAGDNEIIEQFIFYCSIKFKSIFSRDQNLIKTYCINDSKDDSQSNSPLSLVSNFFNKKNSITDVDIERFSADIDRLIGLPRKTYSRIITCYQNIYHSLLHLNTNVDLSYSQLVYCLESLAQNFDEFIPVWDDYDQNIRSKLDDLLSTLRNEELTEQIRALLLKSSNLKNQARFINFILQYTNDSFFQDEAHNSKFAIKKLDLKTALVNTYGQRSSFVHALKSMKKEAKMPRVTVGEVFSEEGSPFLTYRGLIRLTLHVVTNFINIQPYLETEKFNWHDELPNLIQIEWAPEYWVANIKGFKPEDAAKRFEGFISAFASTMQNNEKVFKFEIRPLLELYEKLMPNSKKIEKLNMYALYVLYNKMVVEELELANSQSTINKYQELFDECSIQAMVVALFKKDIWKWDANTSELTLMKYMKQNLKSRKISLPNSVEVTLIIAVANLYHEEADETKFRELLLMAINQLAGLKQLQDKLLVYLNECELVPSDIILSPKDNSDEEIEYII